MALIGFTGFETGDIREYVTLGGTGGGNSGTTIVSSIKRTGDYALRINPSNAAARINSPDYGDGFSAYITFYFYVASMPSSANTIAMVGTGAAGARIQLNGSGSVTLYNGTSSSGSAGTVIAETWNRIDYKHVDNGTCELSLNGGSAVTITAPDLAQHFLYLGSRLENATYDIYYDDVVMDDAQFWATPQIVRMDPDGDGTDATGFTGGTGSTYAEVDEVPPDDDTTRWGVDTAATGMARSVTFESAASAGVVGEIHAIKALCIMRSTGGNNTFGQRLRHGSFTDDVAVGTSYLPTSRGVYYTEDIDGTGAWVESDLDDLEIGAVITNGGSGESGPSVTAIYLMVLSAGPSLGPEIDDVDPDTLAHGDTGIDITGSGFGATQGSGSVIVSPTDDVDDVNAATQTVTSWGDTGITFTANQGGITPGSAYLFVVDDDGNSNEDGFPVTLVPVAINVSDTLSLAVTEAVEAAETITASDTLSLALTEAIAIVEALTAEDTLGVVVDEGTPEQLDLEVIEVADTLSLAISDEVVTPIPESVDASDTLSLALTEALAVFDTLDLADSLVVVVTDDEDVLDYEEINASDTLSLAVSEEATGADTVTSSDTLGLALTEAAEYIVTFEALGVSDTLTIGLTETAALQDDLSVSDTLAVTVSESTTILELMSVADTLAVHLDDTATADDRVLERGNLNQPLRGDRNWLRAREGDILRGKEGNLLQ